MQAADSRTSVLIVEDEDLVAATLTRWLGGVGYDVAHVTSAEEALEQMLPVNPSVVICDIGLPGRDGMWLADRVRKEYPRTALVLATGRDNLPPAETMRSGIVSYLVKPFGRDELRKAVGEAVSWHQDAAATERWPALDLEQEMTRRTESLDSRLRALHLERDLDSAIEMLFPNAEDRASIERVSALAAAMANELKLPPARHDDLMAAVRLHRLWRMIVPEILHEPLSALSHRELALLRRAPAQASELLAARGISTSVRALLRSMRERFNGLGGPDRLVADRIPPGTRILAVAEAVDAMTRARLDRPARSVDGICRELQRCAGSQFDPDAVRIAVALLSKPASA
jgi:response regulator RpfG family c-di-GMP phosphodiesterase